MTLVRYYPRMTGYSRISDEWKPAVDIIEHENDYIFSIDLPGFERSDINLKVDDGVLTISGERKCEEPGDENYYRYFERPYGRFARSFRIPDNVDHDKVDAVYQNGLLELKLAKKEESKPRTIKVS
ncbi:Hsp20/alpha crystallin family protein [Candidatus Latescibacterota bacterium]